MSELTTVISTVGFPICACLGLGYYINQTTKFQREDSTKREEKLFQQLDSNNKVMDNFNETMISMDSRLDNIEKKVGECHKCE